jgi:hypothetical protein
MRLFLLLFFLASCSSSDDKSNDSNKPIPAREPFFTPSEKLAIETELGVDMSRAEVEAVPISEATQRQIEIDTSKKSKQLIDLALAGDIAIGQIMLFASKILIARGETEAADIINKELADYTALLTATYFSSDTTTVQGTNAVGDHAPLSEHINDMYARLETALGKDIMTITRLTDIRLVNYTAPVVFQPRGIKSDKWNIDEYRLHFVPFSGVVAYWSVFTSCVGVTEGVGVITFVCVSVAEKSRTKIEKSIAPTISDIVYTEANL